MLEHEPQEPEDISERLIPEIPGVVANLDDENWGDLTEDPDEESQEDLVGEISKEVRTLLATFGVEGLNGVPQAEITRLWERMGMDNYLIADLALYSLIDTQRLFKDDLRQPKFKDLHERSEVYENPYDVRVKLIENIAPNLQKIGYGQLKAYRLPRGANEDMAMAFKVEGWLAGLSFMEDLPMRIKSERAAAEDRKLVQADVFKVTRDEIVRQARIAESDETKKEYDFRLKSNLEAYDQLLKNIRNAYRIADVALARHIAR